MGDRRWDVSEDEVRAWFLSLLIWTLAAKPIERALRERFGDRIVLALGTAGPEWWVVAIKVFSPNAMYLGNAIHGGISPGFRDRYVVAFRKAHED